MSIKIKIGQKNKLQETTSRGSSVLPFPTVDISNIKNFLSEKPFIGFKPDQQTPAEKSFAYEKPKGLWYSCGTDWLDWLKNEQPDWLAENNFLYQIEIDISKILVLKSMQDLENFTKKFQVKNDMLKSKSINWPLVAENFAGIEICPYQDSARYALSWYYSWDVASGCIWNASAIRDIKLIEKRNRKKAV